VAHNTITQANCGSLPIAPCADLRSEGIVLRRVADGTVVQDNQINNVQAGIFINGGSDLHIIGNTITSVDALSAIHLMGATDSTLDSNRIFNVGPIDSQASLNQEGCGINSVPGTGNARNLHSNNLVSNAYCGIAYSPTDQLTGNIFTNTLYQSFDSSLYAKKYPPVP